MAVALVTGAAVGCAALEVVCGVLAEPHPAITSPATAVARMWLRRAIACEMVGTRGAIDSSAMSTEPTVEEVRLVERRLAWRVVEEEVLALDIDASEYLSINRTGALLWEALSHGSSPTELASLLADRAQISRARAQTDVDAFLGQLRERGLIATRPATKDDAHT